MKKNKLMLTLALATLCVTVGCGGKEKNPEIFSELGYTDVDAYEKAILGNYDAKYRTAAAKKDTAERFRAFAEAEYNLIYEEAIIVPWYTATGYSASVARTIPHQSGTAPYGLSSDKLKNVVVSDTPLTKEQRNAVNADWEAHKAGTAPAVDGDGFTSLANQHEHGAVDAQGYYHVGDQAFKVKNEFKYSYTNDDSEEIGLINLNPIANARSDRNSTVYYMSQHEPTLLNPVQIKIDFTAQQQLGAETSKSIVGVKFKAAIASLGPFIGTMAMFATNDKDVFEKSGKIGIDNFDVKTRRNAAAYIFNKTINIINDAGNDIENLDQYSKQNGYS